MSDAPRFGVLLPSREQVILGNLSMSALVDFARRVEELGFDSVWTGDSLVARPRLDPLITLTAAGTATTRVTLGTAALTPALRHPVVGASMVSSLDHACGGRLTLGLGSGFPMPETEDEFGLVDAVFAGRAGRLDEITDLWRTAWRSGSPGTPVDFTGRHWQAAGLDRLPSPYRSGGPPLWLAGSDTPAVLRRVARRYDGWLPFLPSADSYAAARETIARLCVEAGRPADAVVPGLYATLTLDDDPTAARAELEDYVQRYYGRPLEMMMQIQAYGWGSAQTCAQWLRGYLRAGARHVVIRIGSLDAVSQLERIGAELLPALRAVADEPVMAGAGANREETP
ncbi:LLM class flavin-dependent oxidoreductase [Micromonospora sp. NPDC000207]|uniref:LLM class flavin-dependent oxidoreductase n=1 Tax=Micromonospora sp. NPDC000207 TaxID=3154246 RepID=UPI00332DE922